MLNTMKGAMSPNEREVIRLRAFLPPSIRVHVERSEDGGFCASVTSIPGVRTEADTFSELIDMVNDAVLTHFEVSAEVRPDIPAYLPPLEVVRTLDLFPNRVDEDISFELAVREETAG